MISVRRMIRYNYVSYNIFAISIALFFVSLCLCSHADAADIVAKRYYKAKGDWAVLQKSPKKMRYRDQWMKVITSFDRVWKYNPRHYLADNALFMSAVLYKKMFGVSSKSSDIKEALERFIRVQECYPMSNMADDAQYEIAKIYEFEKKDLKKAYIEYSKISIRYPDGDMVTMAGSRLSALERSEKFGIKVKDKRIALENIRYWSAEEYTRVVIDFGSTVSYNHHLLKQDIETGKPQRLFIDINNSRLDRFLTDQILIRDGILKKIRVGQNTRDIVRVVLDIEHIGGYKVFSLPDPFRIVIDVNNEKTLSKRQGNSIMSENHQKDKYSLASQLGLDIKRVVIDPGHGGKDPGAIGAGGIKEKDIVLSVAKRLKKRLEDKAGLEVFMTREKDVFLPLEERTAIANTKKADLFISIHVNAHRRSSMKGTETYFLDFASDEDSMALAAKENATSTQKMSDLEKILNELLLNSKINESSMLASHVQNGIVKNLEANYKDIKDRGVKQAPFYVLIGAHMPAVLVELSFITNKEECRRLSNSGYQDKLANGIVSGIKKYIDDNKKTSL